MSFDQSRYPDNWDEISLNIRTQASWTCEACGRVCRCAGETWEQFCKRMGWNAFEPTRKRGHYVLTVAHLDQDPQNCERSNLKAFCAPCHLRYDARFRPTQKRLRAEYFGQQRIDVPSVEGLQLSLLSGHIAPFSLPLQGKAPTEGKLLSPLEQGFDPISAAGDDRIVDQSCSGGDGEKKRAKRRRHTPKGSASGWIEERAGNKKRKNPTVSYYYRWDEPDDRGTVYLPIAISGTVKRMVEVERQSVSKVLEYIRTWKKTIRNGNN